MQQHPQETTEGEETAPTTDNSLDPDSAIELAAGGFTPETEVITTNGLTTVADLSVGDTLYALHSPTSLVKRKPVTVVTTVTDETACIAIETARINLHVTPDHRIPYRTKHLPRVRFKRAGALPEKREYKLISQWRQPPREPLDTVDITEFLNPDEYEICATHTGHGHHFRAQLPEGCTPTRSNSHTGYYFDPETFDQYQATIEEIAADTTIHAGPNCWRRPYRFDGDDFIRLLGWFVAEGCVHWPDDSDTAEVLFAQKTDSYRRQLATLFDRLGLRVSRGETGFTFSSTTFGTLFERLCGDGSHDKHLPDLVWTLPREQQELLLDTLLRGDGNDRGTYYTASDRLASEMLRLCIEVGIKPRYTIRDGIWQCFTCEVNDGIDSTKHVTRTAAAGPFYRLAVQDYGVILAGRNGKFQWVGVSAIS